MKELIRLKIRNYEPRMAIITALNESGYGTRVIEEKDPDALYSRSMVHIVIVYDGEVKDD